MGAGQLSWCPEVTFRRLPPKKSQRCWLEDCQATEKTTAGTAGVKDSEN